MSRIIYRNSASEPYAANTVQKWIDVFIGTAQNNNYIFEITFINTKGFCLDDATIKIGSVTPAYGQIGQQYTFLAEAYASATIGTTVEQVTHQAVESSSVCSTTNLTNCPSLLDYLNTMELSDIVNMILICNKKNEIIDELCDCGNFDFNNDFNNDFLIQNA